MTTKEQAWKAWEQECCKCASDESIIYARDAFGVAWEAGARAETARAEAMLAELEWSAPYEPGGPDRSCPSCGTREGTDHRADCPIRMWREANPGKKPVPPPGDDEEPGP